MRVNRSQNLVEYVLKRANDIFIIIQICFDTKYTIHMLLTAMANKVSYQLCLYIHLTYTKIHTNKCINTVDTGT